MPISTDQRWYHLIDPEDRSLMQGDLLFDFRHLVPTAYANPARELRDEDEGKLSAVYFDVVVLTASCDLAHENRVDSVLLCPHWDYEEAARQPQQTGIKPSSRDNIEKGWKPRFCLLAGSDIPELPMGLRVADFNRIFQVPRRMVDAHCARAERRLRMNAPYREHLAQSFALCISRIGLPVRPTVAPTAQTQALQGLGEPGREP